MLGNDSDSDPGDTITAVLVAGPSHAASFALNANGSFNYAPAADYNGGDSFTYKARDSHGVDSATVTASITVNAVNDPPTGTGDGYPTDEDTALVVAAPGVLGNDSDPDAGDSIHAQFLTTPAHAATFSFGPTGAFDYTPAADYNGPDSFTYQVVDSHGAASAPVTVTITVNAVNDPPTAIPDSYSTNEDTTLSVSAPGLLENDSDPDTGDAITAELMSLPAHLGGLFSFSSNGSFSYVPAGELQRARQLHLQGR